MAARRLNYSGCDEDRVFSVNWDQYDGVYGASPPSGEVGANDGREWPVERQARMPTWESKLLPAGLSV